MNDRIYVCHTYYHVYVTFLKELNLPKEMRGQAVLVLSKMSNDFEELKSRVEGTGLLPALWNLTKKERTFFHSLPDSERTAETFFKISSTGYGLPDFMPDWRSHTFRWIFVNIRTFMCTAIRPDRLLSESEENYYHALEDGLNCLKNFDAARYDNRGHFGLKAFLSRRLNLIFVQNGYGNIVWIWRSMIFPP